MPVPGKPVALMEGTNAMWWKRATNWMRYGTPSPGQQYRDAGRNWYGHSPTAVWELETVVVGSDGIEYARLVRMNDRKECKLVSLSALFDRSLYESI